MHDIKTQVQSAKSDYPSSEQMSIESTLNYLPASLRLVLEELVVGKDVRPKAVITPLLLGLGI